MSRALLIVVALLLAAPRAAAEPEPSWQSRPFALSVAGSMWGSPTGVVGANADYAIVPWFSASAGAGLGGVAYHGPKGGPTPLVAFAGRFRALADAENAATAAVGLSMGPYAEGTYCVDCEPDGDTVWTWDWAYWSDFSLGYELRRSSGFTFQFDAGAEYLLNSSSDACYQMSGAYGGQDYTPCTSHGPLHHIVFPFARVAVGYAF